MGWRCVRGFQKVAVECPKSPGFDDMLSHRSHRERQKSRPDLPLDRVLVVPDEVVELACLLEFLEKQLDRPSCAVEFRHRFRGPLEVVREEDHPPHLAAHFDHRRDAPERPVARRVLPSRSLPQGTDDLVLEDLRALRLSVVFDGILERLHDFYHQVRLLSHDEEDVTERERVRGRERRGEGHRDLSPQVRRERHDDRAFAVDITAWARGG